MGHLLKTPILNTATVLFTFKRYFRIKDKSYLVFQSSIINQHWAEITTQNIQDITLYIPLYNVISWKFCVFMLALCQLITCVTYCIFDMKRCESFLLIKNGAPKLKQLALLKFLFLLLNYIMSIAHNSSSSLSTLVLQDLQLIWAVLMITQRVKRLLSTVRSYITPTDFIKLSNLLIKEGSHKWYATLTTLAIVWALWSFKIFIWFYIYIYIYINIYIYIYIYIHIYIYI